MSSHKNNYCGIGVMTGTSLDGVDLVCATFSDATPSAGHRSESTPPWSYEMHQAESLPLPDAWRERLRALPSQSASALAQTHVDWGHFLGKIKYFPRGSARSFYEMKNNQNPFFRRLQRRPLQ